jgi:hypothetical protein
LVDYLEWVFTWKLFFIILILIYYIDKKYFDESKEIKNKLEKNLINYFEKVKINVENKNCKKVLWIDIWEIDANISQLESIEDSSWNMYYQYKLSMINTWHVLEDRITILFLFFLFCL